MYDVDAIKRIVELLKQSRSERQIPVEAVYHATNIPVRVVKQIEDFNEGFYTSNKVLFIRYCRLYQEFLAIPDNEDFDRIREYFSEISEGKDLDPEDSKKPSADNFELSVLIIILCWISLYILNNKIESKIIDQIDNKRLIYLENITG